MEPFCDLSRAIMLSLEQVPVINDVKGSEGKHETKEKQSKNNSLVIKPVLVSDSCL